MLDNLNLDEIVLPNETKHQIYIDAAQPAVSETGKFLGRIPRAINAALSSLDCWILTKENNVAKTKLLLEKNLENVNPDKIVSPEPYVAVPAIQALSYSMESDELRNMYANLLAKSMHIDSKKYVHPSFSEIIKQLSPVDARIFQKISDTQFFGIVDLVSESDYSKEFDMYTSYNVLETNISGFNIASHQIQSASFDLLNRLGLINIQDDSLTDNYVYSRIELSSEYQSLKKLHTSEKNVTSKKKSFSITSFGSLFAKVCVNDSILVE